MMLHRLHFKYTVVHVLKPVLGVLLVSIFSALQSLLAQQTEIVDFQSITAVIEPVSEGEMIRGTVRTTFIVLKEVDSVYLDAVNMTVESNALEGVPVRSTDSKIWFKGPFERGKEYSAFFRYSCSPKQTLYFTGDQIWTQGQGKYTSHWLPSLDDMNDKLEFDLRILAPEDQTVIANGHLLEVRKEGSVNSWQFDMKSPMSSYLVAFVVGKFEKDTLHSGSGIPLELYYSMEDSSKAEPTYRYTKKIFDFLEAEIGVPYPWQNYKQVPVRDFLYAGMENTTATIFSEAFVVDSTGFNDRNYINVNAHELAHHWFGNLVTETTGIHHWLQEGFATFYAHLVEKEVFGTDYYYWTLYNTAEQLKEMSDTGNGKALVNANASSLTFYEKGAWALIILRELIGEEAFKTAVRNYLNKYQFKNVETEDFVAEVRTAASVDISQWEADWLYQSAFKAEQALKYLSGSSFMDQYFRCSALRSVPFEDKEKELLRFLKKGNEFVQQEVIYQLEGLPLSQTLPFYRLAITNENLYVRQSIALSLVTIPQDFQSEYETLLSDSSYRTLENVLFRSWSNFPEKQADYLKRTEGIIGFQDMNIRQLWLALAIVTSNFRIDKKSDYTDELRSYTSAEYSFEIRQKAFEFIHELRLYNEDVIKNLLNAATHHNWRFRNNSRQLLAEVLKNPGTLDALNKNIDNLSEKERLYLQKLDQK